jgi:hypothetical protein
MAGNEGLSIDPAPPDWVVCLSQAHDAPYDLRYATRFHILVLPATRTMAEVGL